MLLFITIYRTLLNMPAPWSGSVRADIQYEVHITLKAINALCSSVSTIPATVRHSLRNLQSQWTTQQCGNMPLFVINLDKRTDR